MKKTMIAVLYLLASAASADARYIDYPGGWTVMQMNDGENNSLHIHHTLAPHYSIGYDLDYWREEEWTLHTGQVVWLVQRWNFTEAQANLYLRGALGAAHGEDGELEGEVEPAGFAGIAFDAEDRRFY